MSVQTPQLADYCLTGNRGNFLYVEGSTACLFDCPQFVSPLYEADKCFSRIPIYYQDTVMFLGPIPRQTFQDSTLLSCYNNPQNAVALQPEKDEQYVPTPRPVLQAFLTLFGPKQNQSALNPNTLGL